MVSTARAFLILTLVMLASNVSGQGFQLNVQELTGPATPGSHSSDWTFRVQQRNVQARWTCSAFSHSQSPQLTSDTQLSVNVLQSQGPLMVSPANFQGRTDVYSGKLFTGFDMQLRGSGKTDLRVTVTIDQTNAAAGKHECAIELTIVGL